ncbi:MAG: FAD-dependent oxidoreductase [Cellvibrionaceae bacterium]
MKTLTPQKYESEDIALNESFGDGSLSNVKVDFDTDGICVDDISSESLSPLKKIGKHKIAIIGAGPVGIRFAKELSQRMSSPCTISIYGAEPYEPYDRIKLSQLLAGTINYPDIFINLHDEKNKLGHGDTNIAFQNSYIVNIDIEHQSITDSTGEKFTFDKLIIATGSKPHIPQIKGVELDGVYTFRNIRDTEKLLSRINRSRHIIVVGGGLLGLEAAKGLLQNNTQVTLIHQSSRLMNRQLNDRPAEELLKTVLSQGISVITNDGLGAVNGDGRVASVVTRHGRHIECDTVVLCTGIKPNTELALSAGIRFNRGIVIDKNLKTSVENIYAIGECTEFNGSIYGLVAPGLEQASVLADNFSGGNAIFLGTQPYTKLKVMNAAVSSIGEVADLPRRPRLKVITYQRTCKNKNTKGELQRKGLTKNIKTIVIEKGRLLGACSVGEWPDIQRVRETFVQHRYVFPWQVWLFRVTGRLWFFEAKENVLSWPDTAIVCQCNLVSRLTIDTEIKSGNNNINMLSESCGAGGVCGSCQPLLQNLIDANLKYETGSFGINQSNDKSSLSPILFMGSLVALAVALALLIFPGVETPDSVQTKSLSWLWNEKFYKQVSGFSLLSITVIGLLLSLRKRLRWKFLGDFSRWRLVHVFLGVIALGILFAHTGAHLGQNLNRWLMVNYLLAAAVGSFAGIAISFTRHSSLEINIKKYSFWLHLLVVWPLPVLIVAHIASSYYF